MKKIKTLLAVLILILFFSSCVSSRGCSTRAVNYNSAIIR